MKRYCIACDVFPGQFSGEYVVEAEDINGQRFSLFCPEEFVFFEQEPSFESPAKGLVTVTVVERKQGLVLVRLPRHTLENGPYATVAASTLRACSPSKKAAKHDPVEC